MDLKEVPAGFGMALMRNEAATNAYAMMTREQKQQILTQARSVRTQAEMQSLVSKIALDNPQ